MHNCTSWRWWLGWNIHSLRILIYCKIFGCHTFHLHSYSAFSSRLSTLLIMNHPSTWLSENNSWRAAGNREIEPWMVSRSQSQRYKTLCRMAYIFFLPQPELLLSVLESTGMSPPKVRKTRWTHPGSSQNKLLIITDIAPKSVPS